MFGGKKGGKKKEKRNQKKNRQKGDIQKLNYSIWI
jgi:hypothetical protein